jgi:hypothetical protein
MILPTLNTHAIMGQYQKTKRVKKPMKALLSCTFGKVCKDIPGTCIVLQMILVVVLCGALGYLFVTQELLG